MSKIVANKYMVGYCFDSIMKKFNTAHVCKVNAPKEWSGQRCPMFVTLKKGDRLRGCIGNFSDLQLDTGLWEYARTSAFGDYRFSPLKSDEVKELNISVSLLVEFEECKDIYDWEVGKHGIRIKFPLGNSGSGGATYLPEVAEEWNWDHLETYENLVKKAGYRGNFKSNLKFFEKNMKVTRYQSSKMKMDWKEYCEL